MTIPKKQPQGQSLTYTKPQQLRKILKIAIPSGANNFLDIINLSVGMYFMGALGAAHLVALGLSLGFVMLLYTITTIIAVGTTAQVSRYFGARNLQKANEALTSVGVGAVVLSVPVVLAIYPATGAFFGFMLGAEIEGKSQIIALGSEYLSVTLLGFGALMFRSTLVGSLTALGATKPIFYVKIVVSALNLALSYALIFGLDFNSFGVVLSTPSLGIFGAGLTNLITSIIECLGLFLVLKRGVLGVKFAPRVRFCYIKEMLKIGIPSGIERGFSLFSLILIAKFMGEYSVEVIAGFQIGQRVENFILMPGFGFQVASMALVGQSIGAGRIDIAKGFIRTILTLSCVIMGVMGVGICFLGEWASSVFSMDAEVIKYSWRYLVAVGLSQIPLIAIFVLDGALRGAGATKLSLMINTTSIWLLRILPMSLCVLHTVSVEWIFFIIFLETYARAGLFFFVFKRNLWQRFIARI